MTMKLSKEHWGYRLVFTSGIVQLIRIDFRLGLVLADGPEVADLYVETSFYLIDARTELVCFPENPESLAPILALANNKAFEIKIENSGRLTASFENGLSIRVDPHASYEAWQIGGANGFLLVCRPGGGVSFFKERPSTLCAN
jgi:hypothetical protein